MPPAQATAPAAGPGSDWESHSICKILRAQASLTGIRISVHKDFWHEFRDVDECPVGTEDDPGPDPKLWPRIVGTVKKWQTKQGGPVTACVLHAVCI